MSMDREHQVEKPRVLTGDTPTGKLHLGHWLGSLEQRVRLQDSHECYFIIANMHAFTTNALAPKQIRASIEEILLDYLAVGIAPHKSNVFLQSEVPAIAELTFLFSMLLPLSRVMRNPTIKSEIRDKQLGENYPFGFLLYPIGQIADILAFRPNCVPVGEDQLPHLEMTKEVARRFNQLYCTGQTSPENLEESNTPVQGLFPEISPLIGNVGRLVGTGGPDENGNLLKMSKSLGNSILLSDSADDVKKKIMKMYTDPNRLKATDPGRIKNNPLWIFHDAFNNDKEWVEEAKQRYKEGSIGDVECKHKLIDSINDFLDPIRIRRKEYAGDRALLNDVLLNGTENANKIAEQTLYYVKELIHQDIGMRTLSLKV